MVVDTQTRTNPSVNAVIHKIKMPEPLRNNGNVRDELNITNGKVTIIRRISNNGSILAKEVIEEYDDINLETFKDDTYIYIREYPNVEYMCRYVIDNDYLDTFATQQELQDATVELNSSITQTEKNIKLEVSEKVGKDEVCSTISQSAEEILLKGNRVLIQSDNFTLNKDGTITCKNANIIGKITVGGDQENPEFISTDGINNTYIFPLGLYNEVNGNYACIQKAGFGCGTGGEEIAKIDVYGMQHLNVYNDSSSSSANVRIDSAGYFHRATGSSKRWKRDVTTTIEDRLNPKALYELPVKQFKYKKDYLRETDKRYDKNILGFIAEDVAKIYEPAVEYDENGQIEMWNSDVMIPALLKLIQELHKDVENLKETVAKTVKK